MNTRRTCGPLLPVFGLGGKVLGVGTSEDILGDGSVFSAEKDDRNWTYEAMSVISSHDDQSVIKLANFLQV